MLIKTDNIMTRQSQKLNKKKRKIQKFITLAFKLIKEEKHIPSVPKNIQ